MKRSALTIGAVTVLGQGTGLAGLFGSSKKPCPFKPYQRTFIGRRPKPPAGYPPPAIPIPESPAGADQFYVPQFGNLQNTTPNMPEIKSIQTCKEFSHADVDWQITNQGAFDIITVTVTYHYA